MIGKGMTLEEAERWLAPNLRYDPDQERKTAADLSDTMPSIR